jgi:RNA polymerase sigma-70 factor (ECF subfamily)
VGARDDQRSDRDLAAAAARGERGAIDVLLARHVDRVHAVCRRILGNDQDALDATQEALIAITRGIASFDGRAQFTTWCYRVATNAALDESRRRRRRPRATEVVPEAVSSEPATDARVADVLDVDAALAALPEEFRAAVALRDLAGLDYAEIAIVLDIPAGTVRSRIARGRAALADALGNREDTPDRPTHRTL